MSRLRGARKLPVEVERQPWGHGIKVRLLTDKQIEVFHAHIDRIRTQRQPKPIRLEH